MSPHKSSPNAQYGSTNPKYTADGVYSAVDDIHNRGVRCRIPAGRELGEKRQMRGCTICSVDARHSAQCREGMDKESEIFKILAIVAAIAEFQLCAGLIKNILHPQSHLIFTAAAWD